MTEEELNKKIKEAEAEFQKAMDKIKKNREGRVELDSDNQDYQKMEDGRVSKKI